MDVLFDIIFSLLGSNIEFDGAKLRREKRGVNKMYQNVKKCVKKANFYPFFKAKKKRNRVDFPLKISSYVKIFFDVLVRNYVYAVLLFDVFEQRFRITSSGVCNTH